jgi:hypothetical protein
VVDAARDGFRIEYAVGFKGGFNDALVINKTDGQDPVVDGCIAFTNTPSDDVESLSMKINGDGRVGIGHNFDNTFPVSNRLVIDSEYPFDPKPSGLRFVDLTSLTSPEPNPGTGVLSVDASGDVILVPGNSGVGGYCGTAAPLTNHYDIPLANNNYYFSDPGGTLNDGENFVKIGDNCGTPLTAKLQVHRGITTNSQFQVSGAYSLNDDIAQSTPFSGYGFGASGNATGNNRFNGGVYGTSSGATTNSGGYFEALAPYVSSFVNSNNYGISVFAQNAQTDIGIFAQADGAGNQHTAGSFTANNAISNNTGVAGGSNGSATINFGGRFSVNAGLNTNIGVYASVPATGSTEYAGYFNGDVNINGTLTVTTYGPSDQNLKTNIDSINNALSIIKQLKPKTFFFDTLNTHNLNLPSQKQYGLIAQQVETILPELVSSTTKIAEYDSLGNITNPAYTYKTLNYNSFIAILMKGLQEQQSKIDSLKAKTNNQDSINEALQSQINQILSNMEACCNSNHSVQANSSTNTTSNASPGIDVKLIDAQSIVLEQNVPNPFAEQTTINYYLPENVNKAQILFYNAGGKLIQSVELKEKGKGQLNVFASDLTNGIYTYTLVADGKIIETKKMVKQ